MYLNHYLFTIFLFAHIGDNTELFDPRVDLLFLGSFASVWAVRAFLNSARNNAFSWARSVSASMLHFTCLFNL